MYVLRKSDIIMFNDTILTIETRKPYTFKLTKNNYCIINEEYNSYSRRQYHAKNIFSKLLDRFTNKSIDIYELPTTWDILYRRLDNHIIEYGRGSIIADGREIYAEYKKHLDYATEMSTEIIVNMSLDREVKLFFELYKNSEDNLLYDNYFTLKPLEALVVKPGSYIRTVSKENSLFIVHISPIYISDGLVADPIYDRVFIDESVI